MLTAEDRDSLRTRISELCVLKFGARYECCFWGLFPPATLPAPTPLDFGERGIMSWASVMLGERPVTLAPVSMRYCLLCAEDAAPKKDRKKRKVTPVWATYDCVSSAGTSAAAPGKRCWSIGGQGLRLQRHMKRG